MKLYAILLIAIMALFITSCKKDDFGKRTEWPVSGIENIDTEWFKPNLSDATPRYSDGVVSICYSDGGVIHSHSVKGTPTYRFVDLTTGTEVIVKYEEVNAETSLLLNPSVTVDGNPVQLRHAKLEYETNGVKWISMSKPDKTNIVLVVK